MTQEVDTFLEHFGVKGMRWGVRRGDSGDSSSASKPKKAKVTSRDIKDARKRQDDRLRDFQEKSADYYTSRSSKGEALAERKMRNAEWDLYNNPDAKTANRFTTGEKWATAAIIGLPAAINLAIYGASR